MEILFEVFHKKEEIMFVDKTLKINNLPHTHKITEHSSKRKVSN